MAETHEPGSTAPEPPPWRAIFDAFPYHQYLDLKVEKAEAGYARISIPTGPKVDGGVAGSVHGGILASLVDIAMLEAVIPTFEEGDQPGGTIDLGITYLRPSMGERITVEAKIVRRGREIVSTEVSILDDQDRLCARGRVLYKIRRVG
ncbi:MAG: PaaI family thioesterase [Myxococcota bacterium]|nr:PaaI family thioesterase [Myxococcota bacterium]